MAVAEKLILNSEEYLEGEKTAAYKHEYQQGKVWAMVGATDDEYCAHPIEKIIHKNRHPQTV